jgi:uncharacterized protein YkwD
MRRATRAVILLAACLTIQAGQTNSSERPVDAIERRAFELVNRERSLHRLKALEWDQRLADAARSHARRMAQHGFFSHVDPERGDLAERLKESKIPWRKTAENLFTERGFADPAERTVLGWMNSPGHRRNVLDKDLTRAGVGAARAPDGSVYVVQIYIRPQAHGTQRKPDFGLIVP